MDNDQHTRQHWRTSDRTAIAEYQLRRLNELLAIVLRQNDFYRRSLGTDQLRIKHLDELASLPLVTKTQLMAPTASGIAAHHTWTPEHYRRLHRTSGTHGQPLTILDTAEDWEWWIRTWQYVLDAAGITDADRALMAFSFGPFIGFWSGYDALAARGALLIPAGGLTSAARLKLALDSQATVLCCTPTYALHLATVAREAAFDLRTLSIRRIIVAGEPGGSIPAVRRRIEAAWNADVTDHAGATEIGPWGFGSHDGLGLHIVESEFIAEVLSPDDQSPVAEGASGELVLTALGRTGAPVIRYRTGDLVRARRRDDLECRFLWLEGGITGRLDDMFVIRGVNVFPSAIEAIVRDFPAVDEFRIILRREREMDELELQVESLESMNHELLANALQARLGLRIAVNGLPLGSLPRNEGKANRLQDLRNLQSTNSR